MSEIPPYDPGHPAVGTSPAWLSTSVQNTTEGQVMILTVRVPNATLTVVLPKADAETWDRQIHQTVKSMSGLIISPAGSINSGGHPLG